MLYLLAINMMLILFFVHFDGPSTFDVCKNFVFTFRSIHNRPSSNDKPPASKWALGFHELATNRENDSRRKSARATFRKVFRRSSVVVRKREREFNCINYRAGCIFTPPPRYANIVSPCPTVCAPGDLFYGPLNLKSATLFSHHSR